MGNIWSFLLQTLSASLAAGIILLVKWLLTDKLSPRWQYGVWSVLALRVLLPVRMNRYFLLPLPLWLETWKATAEQGLNSAYTQIYQPIHTTFGLPMVNSAPVSLTDWLFVLYAAGVLLFLWWRLVSYLRLRFLLRKAIPADAALQEYIGAVCKTHGLPLCRAATLPGLPSPFICGVFCPLLVLPAQTQVDEKVLLHELLHLKYRDVPQGVFWCLLRALHWCNPFLHYVFRRIGNDMESLCDQRVLERLEGEERREYGVLLLSMANEKYARAVGTSSLSNGGKNISRRIAAIVHFKKYPKGMALVSVCIAVLMASSLLFGTTVAYDASLLCPGPQRERPMSMALARITRCSTAAGALDCYAKGLLYENGVYLALATPLEKHEALEAEMAHHGKEGWVAYHIDPGPELAYLERSYSYAIHNLTEQADGSLSGLLTLWCYAFPNADGIGLLTDEEGNTIKGMVRIPVILRNEDGWVVEESGPRQFQRGSDPHWQLPYLRTLTAHGKTGSVTVNNFTDYRVKNFVSNGSFWGGTTVDSTPKPNAVFYEVNVWEYITYDSNARTTDISPTLNASMRIAELDHPDEIFAFSEVEFPELSEYSPYSSGSSSDGTSWVHRQIDADWDGTLFSGSGGSYFEEDIVLPVPLPPAYGVQILWDGQVREEFLVKEVAP